MSAAQPKPSENPKAADAAKSAAPEPSMEEILASIRKIISDDQAPPPEPEPEPVPVPVAAEPEPEPKPAEEEDVLDLASMMVPQPEPAPEANLADDLDFLPEAAIPEPPPPPPPPAPPPPVAPPPPPQFFAESPITAETLLSQGPNAAVSQAFGSLSHMILSQNARTLDDLVKDMLRPMLKSWLDDNLPALVERLVKAEIERVARGGR